MYLGGPYRDEHRRGAVEVTAIVAFDAAQAVSQGMPSGVTGLYPTYPRIYRITIVVYDALGNTGSDTVTLRVLPAQ